MGIAEAFGTEFLAKYKEALGRKRIRKLPMTEGIRSQIIEMILTEMKPDKPQFQFPYNNQLYSVALAETFPRELYIRDMKWGKTVGFKWQGDWLSAMFAPEQYPLIDTLQTGTPYVLVGYIASKTKGDKLYYNIRIQGLITMEEIEEYKANRKADTEATKEANDMFR